MFGAPLSCLLSPLPRALVGLRALYAAMAAVCVACSLINTQTVRGCRRRRPVAASPPLAACGGSRGSSGPFSSSSRVSWFMGPPNLPSHGEKRGHVRWPWSRAWSWLPVIPSLQEKVGAMARVLLGVMGTLGSGSLQTGEEWRSELTGASRESGLSTVRRALPGPWTALHKGGRGCSRPAVVVCMDAMLAGVLPAQSFVAHRAILSDLLQPFFDVGLGGLL